MALAGQRHVELARQPHAHRAGASSRRRARRSRRTGSPALPCRRTRRPCAGTPPSPGCAARRARAPRSPAFRTDAAWTSAAATTGLVEPCDRRLGFQIEVFLPADRQLAGEMQRARVDAPTRRRGDAMLLGEEAVRPRSPARCQDRGQRLVLRRDARRAAPRRVQRLAPAPTPPAGCETSPRWETAARRGVFAPVSPSPGTSASRQHRHTPAPRAPGADRATVTRACACGASTGQAWSRFGNRPHEVVGVERVTRHVPARALVRKRRAGDASCRCSHQNFSTRLLDTSRRYSFEPRWSLSGFSVAIEHVLHPLDRRLVPGLIRRRRLRPR